jgi:hypothetical protein
MKKAEQAKELAAVEAKGFSALRAGLGLASGNYTLTTPNSEDIFGIKEVTSAKDGKGYALTMVAGTVTGADDANTHVSTVFGLGDKDRQLVVTVDQWQAIDPNQSYTMVVNDKGRIASISLVSEEEIVSTSDVVTTKNRRPSLAV